MIDYTLTALFFDFEYLHICELQNQILLYDKNKKRIICYESATNTVISSIVNSLNLSIIGLQSMMRSNNGSRYKSTLSNIIFDFDERDIVDLGQFFNDKILRIYDTGLIATKHRLLHYNYLSYWTVDTLKFLSRPQYDDIINKIQNTALALRKQSIYIPLEIEYQILNNIIQIELNDHWRDALQCSDRNNSVFDQYVLEFN